jgi:hypothetical protein
MATITEIVFWRREAAVATRRTIEATPPGGFHDQGDNGKKEYY